MSQVRIYNAFEIRDMIKSKGGNYDAATKTWVVSSAAWQRMLELAKSPACGMSFSRGMAKARAEVVEAA